MSDNLQPCPFCGGEGTPYRPPEARPDGNEPTIILSMAAVSCKCGACIWVHGGTADAIAAWNRRVPAPVPDVPVAAIRNVMESLAAWHSVDREMGYKLPQDEVEDIATVRTWLDQQQEER